MAKKKSSERTLMWVFGVVAVVALLGVVALALGDGVTGMARWTSPVFRGKTGITTEPIKTTTGIPTESVGVAPLPVVCVPLACKFSSELGKESEAKCITMTEAEALAMCRRLWGI